MKDSKEPVVTNFTGTINADGKLNLGEEVLVVLRVECTDSPRKKRAGKTRVWKQTGTIIGGVVLEPDSARSNELAEMIAAAMPQEDEDQLTIADVTDDEVDI